jgi:hypothetical protein
VDRESVFDAWAPRDSIWTPWAKPVLFAHVDGIDTAGFALPRATWIDADLLNLADPAAEYRTSAQRPKPAVVVDLPGVESVAVGLALAELGLRPVPLYTALPSFASVVPMEDVVRAIAIGSTELANAALSPSAAPAFLLDARRMGPKDGARVGQFDNRAVTFPGDFPSSERLRSAGIDSVILIEAAGVGPQTDLEPTLVEWQRAGLPILHVRADAPATARPIRVRAPTAMARLTMWWERYLLSRDPSGGIGTWKLERPHGG